MKNLKCPYCQEPADNSGPECAYCGSLLKKITPNRPFLGLLFVIGALYALFTIWVGYNLFFTG